ncbi:electron transport complex subunit RsxE [Candidatus Poribacteria bacterium]|nr:MAG: electron transport complex subunit RsxE [Candidatus Poribacteria bacterium]
MRLQNFTKGLWTELPVLRVLLGFCPTLAVTNRAENGLVMGLATTFVLFFSCTLISIFKKLIPHRIRIPIFIVVIASFVTIVDYLLAAYYWEMHKVLGIYIPLIVVNCLILGRVEAFASKNPVGDSMLDALGMGVGFTLVLVVLGSIRELFGFGTIFSHQVIGKPYEPMVLMIIPPGALLSLGLLLGLMNLIRDRMEGRR